MRNFRWLRLALLVIINDTEERRKEAFKQARCSYETTQYNKGMKTMSMPSIKEYIRPQQQNWERQKRLGLVNKKRRSKLITEVADVLHR